MILTAVKLIRRMRGCTQAQLIEASDNNYYVVKYQENPQTKKILINEWLGEAVLRYLHVTTPQIAPIMITSGFLQRNPEARLRIGRRIVCPTRGWHLGSKYPGHPDKDAVYDYLPDSLLASVRNRDEFLTTLIADKWAGNTDKRQCIFVRTKMALKSLAPHQSKEHHSADKHFTAAMIDHEYWFNGSHWNFIDGSTCGLYLRPLVYGSAVNLEVCRLAIDLLCDMPAEVLEQAVNAMPAEWTHGYSDDLTILLTRLMRRRLRIRDLLRDCARTLPLAFRSWTGEQL